MVKHLKAEDTTTPLFSNRTYTFVLRTAAFVLPLLGALYFGLAGLWDFPNPEKVVGSIAVVNVFFGGLLKFGMISYDNSDAKYDGDLEVSETDSSQVFGVNLSTDPDTLAKQDKVTFKVVPK